MIVELVANIGIIILNIYVIFKINPSSLNKEKFTKKQIIYYIFFETLAGFWLMTNATTIGNTRFDLRLVLFSLGFKYLGWKVMSPAVLFIAISRFMLDSSIASWINLLLAVILLVTLPILTTYLEKKVSPNKQLYGLVTYNALIMSPFAIYSTGKVWEPLGILFLLLLVSYLIIYFLNHAILELQTIFVGATIDDLTQLHNVRMFREVINKQSGDKNATVVMIDIDHFKYYNDQYGHSVGDQILQEVGFVFHRYSTKNTRIYRIGGDEFAILFFNQSPASIQTFISAVQKAIGKIEVSIGGEILTVQLSIGQAVQQNEESLTQTLQRADNYLYQAKNNGRNQLQSDR